jgi:hypothetical protein
MFPTRSRWCPFKRQFALLLGFRNSIQSRHPSAPSYSRSLASGTEAFSIPILFRWLCQCARNQKHLALLLPRLIGVPAKETPASISIQLLLPSSREPFAVVVSGHHRQSNQTPNRLFALHLFSLHLRCRHRLFQLQPPSSSLLFINISLPLLSSFSIVVMVIVS